MGTRARDTRERSVAVIERDDLGWSRYNRLFACQRYGWYLHNALSNERPKLDEAHRRAVEALRSAKMPVTPGEEEGERLAADDREE